MKSLTCPKDISFTRVLFFLTISFCIFSPYAAASDKDLKPSLAFSVQGGFYKQPFYLALSTGNSKDRIYYTLDGSRPGIGSLLYEQPILVKDRTNQAAVFSMIPTNPGLTEEVLNELGNPSNRRAPVWRWSARLLDSRGWLPAQGELFKGTVVRAVAVSLEGKKGETITQSYFVSERGEKRYSLPVLSLAGEFDDFFGEEQGIFVYGKEANPNWGQHPANFRQRGRDWERRVHLEFFESDGARVFAKSAGVRLNGRGGRWSPQKSLRLYARGEYGSSTFNYPFFAESEIKARKRLIVRNGGHAPNLFPNHDLGYRIVNPTGLDSTRSRQVIVFMNGEYWGIQTLNERLDSNFLLREYKIHPKNLIFRKRRELKEGDDEDDRELLAFFDLLASKEMELPAGYQRILEEIDIEQFIEYQAAQIYLANRDWPRNNYSLWKVRDSSYQDASLYGVDGKWRFLFFDLDAGFGATETEPRDPFHKTIDSALGSGLPARMLRNLLKNENFRNSFINHLATRLNTTYSSEQVLKEISKLYDELKPEIDEHVRRWRYPSMAKTYLERQSERPGLARWEKTFEELREFASKRPMFLRKHMLEHFKLEGLYEVKISPLGNCSGYVEIDGIKLSELSPGDKWSGTYFSGIPLGIRAHPASGCCFEKWMEAQDKSPEMVIRSQKDIALKPFFTKCSL